MKLAHYYRSVLSTRFPAACLTMFYVPSPDAQLDVRSTLYHNYELSHCRSGSQLACGQEITADDARDVFSRIHVLAQQGAGKAGHARRGAADAPYFPTQDPALVSRAIFEWWWDTRAQFQNIQEWRHDTQHTPPTAAAPVSRSSRTVARSNPSLQSVSPAGQPLPTTIERSRAGCCLCVPPETTTAMGEHDAFREVIWLLRDQVQLFVIAIRSTIVGNHYF